jgi:hypothetical protein
VVALEEEAEVAVVEIGAVALYAAEGEEAETQSCEIGRQSLRLA